MEAVDTFAPGNPGTELARQSDYAFHRHVQVPHNAPTLVLMAGFAGAGKTTLAKRLAYWLHWEVLNKDDLKLERLAQGERIESAGWNAFEDLFNLLEKKVITQRQSVIIDTSNERPFIFEKVWEVFEALEKLQSHAQLKVILCRADKETRTKRLLERGSVFSPYVLELPIILDDSELQERFKHLPREKMFIVNTNPPLRTYDWKVLKHLTSEEG